MTPPRYLNPQDRNSFLRDLELFAEVRCGRQLAYDLARLREDLHQREHVLKSELRDLRRAFKEAD